MRPGTANKLSYEEKFVYIAPDLLQGALVNRSQFGFNEVISVMTPNKVSEIFHLEVTYKRDANRNGIPPILSATLITPQKNVRLSTPVANKLIRMCCQYEDKQR